MVTEFLLFGVIEVFILLMFYKYVGKINRVKIWHGLVLYIFYFIVGLIQMPFMKQISMILGMFVYICIIEKEINLKYLKLSLKSLIYLLVIESVFCLFYEIILNIEMAKIDTQEKFLYMIVMRVTEITLILLYKKYKK